MNMNMAFMKILLKQNNYWQILRRIEDDEKAIAAEEFQQKCLMIFQCHTFWQAGQMVNSADPGLRKAVRCLNFMYSNSKLFKCC